jgi:hypothetical protein
LAAAALLAMAGTRAAQDSADAKVGTNGTGAHGHVDAGHRINIHTWSHQ